MSESLIYFEKSGATDAKFLKASNDVLDFFKLKDYYKKYGNLERQPQDEAKDDAEVTPKKNENMVNPTFQCKLSDIQVPIPIPGIEEEPMPLIRDLLYAPREAPPVSLSSLQVPSFST